MTTTGMIINGTEGNNRLTGGSGNDVINGNGGNDKLSGGSGADILNGGAGKDELNGGSGNDVLDGGSGSDELEGGSGNDTLIYTLAENNAIGKFTYDEYEGGSGSDTLELRFTRTEWMNEDNQKILQKYFDWASKSGSGCRWDDDFTFRFGNSGNARLEIEDIEKLVVKVDEKLIENLGMNTVDAVEDSIKISEDSTGEEIYVLGNDKANYLVKDLILKTGPANGSVSLFKVDSNDPSSWYFKYSPNNAYQYLNTDLTATDSFKYTVIDAKGKEDTATVTITIEGANDAAIFIGATDGTVIESTLSNNGGKITATGTLTAVDIDNPPDLENPAITLIQTDLMTSTYGYFQSLGDRWLYGLRAPLDVKVLNSDSPPLKDTFTIYSIDGTPQVISITIIGANDPAFIEGTTEGTVIEKGSSNGNGTPQATGELTARDIDNPTDPENPATFQVVTGQESISKYGTYSITADGNWTYKLDNDNASVEALVENGTLPDSFTVYSIDGTPQTITITIQGADDVVNSKPEIEGKGRIANVKELINLNYDNSVIKNFVARGGDYDYLHVRTGQFYVKDAEDSIELEANDYVIDGYLGKFTPIFTGIKNPDGKYLVTWTYEVKDQYLEPLTTPPTGTHSKDQTYTLKFISGEDILTTDVVIYLDGRDDFNLSVQRFDNGRENNVADYTNIQPMQASTGAGNDVVYMSESNFDLARSGNGSDIIYMGSGSDFSYFDVNDSVIFSGNGNDIVTINPGLKDVLAFGGNGDDKFYMSATQGAYVWGGDGSDTFTLTGVSELQSNNWILDFNSSNLSNGVDKISFNKADNSSHIWTENTTKLEEKYADSSHPFLSDGASYYNLQADLASDGNWFSVFNLVGINGAEITLDSLFANGNLNPIQVI